MFATIYTFLPLCESTIVWRIVIVGVSAGLALSVKHTDPLCSPCVTARNLANWCATHRSNGTAKQCSDRQRALKLRVAAASTSSVGGAVAFYGSAIRRAPTDWQLIHR